MWVESPTRTNTIARANELIDAGEPLASIVPLFPNRLEAVRHFATRQAALRSPKRAAQACCSCGVTDGLGLVRFDWRAYVTPASFLHDLTLMIVTRRHYVYRPLPATERVNFSTYDSLCPACARRLRTRKALMAVFDFVATFVLFLSMLALPFACLKYFWLASRLERAKDLPYVWGSLAGLLLGVVLSTLVHALRTPAFLKRIGGPPFRLVAVKPVL